MACNENRIDLKNIKVAVFDFDNTLALHLNPDYLDERLRNEEVWYKFYIMAYKYPENFYDTVEKCIAHDNMQKFVATLRENGIKLYMLTGMPFSFNFQAKSAFAHKHYGDDIECLSTMNQSSKTDALKIIARLNECKREEVLFVDDMPENIKRINSEGFIAILADDVFNNKWR